MPDTPDVPAAALAAALVTPTPPGERGEGGLTLEELAAATEAPVPLLEALVRDGLLVPRPDAEHPWSVDDVEAVQAGLALLAAGVPLSELLALARAHDVRARATAEDAVELFARFVKDPTEVAAPDDPQATAERLVAAVRTMVPATSAIVAHHLRRRLLAAAAARLDAATGAAADPDAAPPPGTA